MTREAPHLLLVHGGSHGAWCWDAAAEELAARGRGATAFDLPGCGVDPTARRGLRLDDSIEAAVAQVDRLPDPQITLVAHSIGGMILPAVAVARPRRVTGLVFLAAVVLRGGERGIDTIPEDRRGSYFTMAAASGDNTLMLDFASAWARFFQTLPEAQARQVYARLTPQPFGPYLQEAPVGIEDVAVPRRYLRCTEDLTFPAATAGGFAARAAAAPEALVADHCAMITAPALVAAALAGPFTR